MKRVAMAVLVLLAGGGATAAPETRQCDIYGWGSKPRTEIRAGPATTARLLAVMRHRADSDEINGTFPEFHINAASNGWFRIDGLNYGDYGDPPPRQRFAGTGWVRGDQIGGQVMAGRLHTGPSQKSRSRPYGKEPDIVSIRRLLDCQGNWAKIEADIGTGWIHGLCNNQVTNCS